MKKVEKNGVVYYEFENLVATGLVLHGFSSRIGGVSKSPYNTMNLAYHMGDQKEDVDENFQKILEALGRPGQIKMTTQVHQANIQLVTKDAPAIEANIDALITDTPGYLLTTYYADCVPLLFLDPVRKVIANAHGGWRGTSLDIAGKTVKKMTDTYGSNPADILVGVGPAISYAHFEVGEEVSELMQKVVPMDEKFMKKMPSGKWHIDLKAVNRYLLLEAGIKASNIEVSDLCTFSDKVHFFSHRRDGVARGNMAAMIALI